MKQYPQALTIAGTDSGGGAGIQADIKTMQACHVFSTNVVVAVTAQNTLDVQKAFALPTDMVDAQFASIYEDFDIKAAKTGMLADAEHVACVVQNIKKYHIQPLIVDPVMVAKGGTRLLSKDAIDSVIHDLIPLATIVTPNLPEAEAITNMTIKNHEDTRTAAKKLLVWGLKTSSSKVAIKTVILFLTMYYYQTGLTFGWQVQRLTQFEHMVQATLYLQPLLARWLKAIPSHQQFVLGSLLSKQSFNKILLLAMDTDH